ncbi:MAG: dihydropteroate synthase [Peptococcaceae bacterium]|nr:dihydropteroate synthase [Peptococcaceae bacterium]
MKAEKTAGPPAAGQTAAAGQTTAAAKTAGPPGAVSGGRASYGQDENGFLTWSWPAVTWTFRPGQVYLAGILNVTPDSFSDGGRFLAPEAAWRRGLALAEEGADMIDVGGQSTRPGHVPVSEDEELARVLPVLTALRRALPPAALISLDTDKAAVAAKVFAAGLADILNDESGGDIRMAAVAAKYAAPIVLMHRPRVEGRGSPAAVGEDLAATRLSYEAQGASRRQIALDPGLGFGKTLEENLRLLAAGGALADLGCPVYIGASRKSFVGLATATERADQRLGGSLTAALWAAAAGASFLRVHDVAVTAAALKMFQTLRQLRPEGVAWPEPAADGKKTAPPVGEKAAAPVGKKAARSDGEKALRSDGERI